MERVKEKIKEQIETQLKDFRKHTADKQLVLADTICRLLDAYHKTERPYYKKRPYKKYEYKKKEGGNYEIKCHTEQ